jgi:hypothetical protein
MRRLTRNVRLVFDYLRMSLPPEIGAIGERLSFFLDSRLAAE